jgi:glycosyltransferase involved in cell wall biosynthesis
MDRKLIVCCSPYFGKDWRWFGPELTDERTDWFFCNDDTRYFWERLIRRTSLATPRACLYAVYKAWRGDADLLITFGIRMAFWCAFLCRISHLRVPIYVYSFGMDDPPTGIKRRLMNFAFQRLNALTVHSTLEINLVRECFSIPQAEIYLHLWSAPAPEVLPAHALIEGAYVSSIGGNGRDYRTLIEAARLEPEIPIVLVARPANIAGLEIPPNVRVMINLPVHETMNILQHSAFTVLPLAGTEVPCGHVTLVYAMHLGKAIVATASKGIADYVIDGLNGVKVAPFSPRDLADAIAKLWREPQEVARLAKNSLQFAEEHCSENTARKNLAEVLGRFGFARRR